MKRKAITVAVSAIAVIAVCTGMIFYVRSGSQQQESGTETETSVITTTAEAIKAVTETALETAATEPETTLRSIEEATEVPMSQAKIPPKPTEPETEVSETEAGDETTAAEEGTTASEIRTSSGTLPKDMTITDLYYQGYDVYGLKKYLFNNDKDCTQSKFGYNRFYDSAASLIDFHIDTCRLYINDYEDKNWMIQMWKGTYITGDIGTVGCEIGLYNRPKGKSGGLANHYNCAKESDWLNMEMTFLWDDEYNGNYKAQFTRTYGKYWWPTGFVDGQLRNVKDTSCLRVLGRITFKDELMAELFEKALTDTGFSKVSTFNPTVKDTFKRFVCDVIFCWQDARD